VSRRIGIWVGGSLALVGAFCFVALQAGLIVNTTKSIPMGLYIKTSNFEKGRVGDYVQICPPQTPVFLAAKQRGYIGAGYCPGGLGYMLKRVLAAKDDVVSVGGEGVRVNGQWVENSVPMVSDGAGRPMPFVAIEGRKLEQGELLLMGKQSRKSFDGRYYGLVQSDQVVAVIQPVFVW
jgi:conjugative transfer signal peptidase TraF